MANESDIINRDEMNSNTNIFYEQQLLAMKIADIFNTNVKKKLKTLNTKKKCIFPTTDTIYTKDIVIEQNNEYHDYKYYENLGNTTNFKGKKKYSDDYYNNYYKNRGYSDNYNNDEDYFYEEENYEDSNVEPLSREKSEQFTAKHANSIKMKTNTKINLEDNKTVIVGKFISKSKSPITNKKKAIINNKDINGKEKSVINSLSPSKKLELQDRSGDENYKTTSAESAIQKSSNSKSDDNFSNANSGNNNISPKKRLYSKRDKSRFDFVKSKTDSKDVNNIKTEPKEVPVETNQNTNEEDEDLEVPDYVFNVISKKISRHTFFRKFEKEFEKEECEYTFFKKQLNTNDSWSKFILANLNTDCKNKV